MKKYWDSPVRSYYQLWLFKLLFCIAVGDRVFRSRFANMDIARTYSYGRIPLFEWLNIPPLPLDTYYALQVAFAIFMFAAAIGIFSRISLFLSLATWFLITGHYEAFFRVTGLTGDSYSHSTVFMVLLILVTSRDIGQLDLHRAFRKDRPPLEDSHWEVTAVRVYLGLVYLCSFYNKMRFGFPWVDGFSQQAVLFRKGMQYNLPLTVELSRHYYLCYFGGIMTCILEGGFLVGTFFRPTKWLFIVLGLSFHISNMYLMEINFVTFFSFVYFIFAYDAWQTVKAFGKKE